MPISFLYDEHVPWALWMAHLTHNASSNFPLDVVRIGDFPDLPFGSEDPEILRWAERENRIIVTEDEKTMPTYLADYLAAGNHSPGLFLLRPSFGIPEIIFHLAIVAHASEAWEWRDRIEYIP